MHELLQEVLREIIEAPGLFAAEVVQFILLLVIITYLLRRILGKDLRERQGRITAEVEEAARSDAIYAKALQEADRILSEARGEAQRIRKKAVTTVEQERLAGRDQVEQEAEAIVLQAGQTVEAEKNRAIRESSEQLIDLVGLVIRGVLEETLTEQERRSLTHKLILARMQELEGTSS